MAKISRRNKRKKATAPSTVQPTDSAPIADQILLDLANGLRNLDERLSDLEHKFNALGTEAGENDEETLMDLRLQGARLSAELTRVTVELRGQIAELAHQFEPITPPTPQLENDESFADLTADSPVRADEPSPTGRRLSGWQPAD
ncbi:MAG TPA: hypothetical protein EYG34_08510 [Acidimicrobiia bacterium]|jgi:small-conductance mechanosensitive channel|nr:hypothetical protein [Acidimicrobiia bacterium]HIL47134.1 hypothetical protein [Acidimicrobiia bacterium]